jgi:hypothetical protein
MLLYVALAFAGGLAVEHYLGLYDKSVGRLWALIRSKV